MSPLSNPYSTNNMVIYTEMSGSLGYQYEYTNGPYICVQSGQSQGIAVPVCCAAPTLASLVPCRWECRMDHPPPAVKPRLQPIQNPLAGREEREHAGATVTRGGGDVLITMLGCSRMNIHPRISTMPGRSMPGFHRRGRHCLHQSRSAVGSTTSRVKGELHRPKNRL